MDEFRKNLKTIHIVGKGGSWCKAPSVFFRDHGKDEEVWGVNNIFMTHRNCDRIFLMHDPRQELVFEDRNFFERVRNYSVPIYTNRKYDVLGPKNEAYPVEFVTLSFPIQYYTNVVCWMLALAILLEPREIKLWGVEMAIAEEYANERGGVEFWIGIAIGRGIHVQLSPNTAVCTTESKWGPLYGYIPKRKKDGLILDFKPDYNGFNKPEVLEQYTLVEREEYEKLLSGCPCKGRKQGCTEEELEDGLWKASGNLGC